MRIMSESERRIKEHEKKAVVRAYRAGQIKILRKQGVSYREIAKELNFKNESSVRSVAKQIPFLDELLKDI